MEGDRQKILSESGGEFFIRSTKIDKLILEKLIFSELCSKKIKAQFKGFLFYENSKVYIDIFVLLTCKLLLDNRKVLLSK